MFPQKEIETIKNRMVQHKEGIAVAESVTAGFLQAALASATDAACYFHGGITAYNLGQKCRQLHIDPINASECDCVSSDIAAEMGRQVCQNFSCSWGIGITGYASPVPKSDNKTFAYYAIIYKNSVVDAGRIDLNEQKDPLTAQLYYVEKVIRKLESTIIKL